MISKWKTLCFIVAVTNGGMHCSFQSDDNKDGKLTLQEMLNHEDIFYNTVYENIDDDDNDDGHDEF